MPILILLAVALCLPALASQASLVTPGGPLPMTSLASFLNSAFLSIGSCNSGTSAPANGPGGAAFAGECWIDTTTNPWVFSYTPDGTNWVEFGTLNTSTLVWTPVSGGTGLAVPLAVSSGGTGQSSAGAAAANAIGALAEANNLSDVANAITALQNLKAFGNGFATSGSATLGAGQVGKLIGNTGSGQTFTLPSAATFANQIFVPLNEQSGTLTVARGGSDLIYGPNRWGVTSLSLTVLGDWVALLSDGSAWHVIGGSPAMIAALSVANNLSDLASAATARGNLGLGNIATQNAGTGLANSGGSLNLQPAQPATIGGIESLTCAAHQWLNTISAAGIPACGQPGFADLSGALSTAQLPGLASAGIWVGNGAGAAAAVAVSGDCTLSNAGALTCTKTNGTGFAASATTDATNAANISSGALPAARLAGNAAANRGAGGLNIDQCTSTGDANYAIAAADRCVYHTSLSAARTDTLPAANSVNPGQEFHLVDFAGAANATDTITLAPSGSDTINGVTSVVAISTQYGAGIFWSDGVSRWTFFPQSSGAGSGTVTSVATGNGLSGGTITTSGTLSAHVDGVTITDSGGPLVVAAATIGGNACQAGHTCLFTTLSNSLGSNVSIPTSGVVDGPSVAQGSGGQWWASGTVTLVNTSTASQPYCELWDGTTVVASGRQTNAGPNQNVALSLSGIFNGPTGNIRISCGDGNGGSIVANSTGFGHDSTISVFRLN